MNIGVIQKAANITNGKQREDVIECIKGLAVVHNELQFAKEEKLNHKEVEKMTEPNISVADLIKARDEDKNREIISNDREIGE